MRSFKAISSNSSSHSCPWEIHEEGDDRHLAAGVRLPVEHGRHVVDVGGGEEHDGLVLEQRQDTPHRMDHVVERDAMRLVVVEVGVLRGVAVPEPDSRVVLT